ncbi:MAG: hypothetical protein JHC28_03390, partial [Thermoprotei archaeon]|nr:hypothetical protein [Thermoprotei archaeon]
MGETGSSMEEGGGGLRRLRQLLADTKRQACYYLINNWTLGEMQLAKEVFMDGLENTKKSVTNLSSIL